MSSGKKSAASAATEPKFNRGSLLNSKRFQNERDLVSALLKNDVEYSISEVEEMIANYMKGTVK